MANMFDTNPNRTTDELLNDIEIGLKQGFNSKNLGAAMAPFAALLVKLSRDAERSSQKIVKLTWGLIALTVGLLAFTAFLAWEDAHKTNEGHDQKPYSQTQQSQPNGIG